MPPTPEPKKPADEADAADGPKMRKQQLDDNYIFEGKHYGPGEVDVPENFPSKAALEKRKSPSAQPLDTGVRRTRSQVPDDEPTPKKETPPTKE